MSDLDIMDLFHRLWPFNRSITGDGVRQSLALLGELVPIKQHEFPTGLQCFDWTVPREWSIREAWIKDSHGRILVDFADHNLHVMSYSVPVQGMFSRDEMMAHLFTRPDLPHAIPYRTSYYKENWGFCLQHDRLGEFTDDRFEVRIDSKLADGSLTIGEGFIQGSSDQEVLLTTYICHPSMANNELSGPIALTAVYHALKKREGKLRYSYRFLYGPETIGPIVYLSQNWQRLKQNVVAGLSLAMTGNDAPLLYRTTRSANALIDRAALNVLENGGVAHRRLDWSPMGGGDQRQYTSLGINLPVGYLTRAIDGSYPEYHSSADDISIISEERMHEAVDTVLTIIEGIESNGCYRNLMPYCEPQLGRRGLYPTTGGERAQLTTRKYINLLGWGDGETDLITIAEKMGVVSATLYDDAETLVKANLLERVSP